MSLILIAVLTAILAANVVVITTIYVVVVVILQDEEIAELKEEALRWSANDTRLRQINRQLLNDNMQLRAGNGWDSRKPARSS